MNLLVIGGVTVKNPSEFTVTNQDVSSDSSGRSLSGLMNKDRVAQKRKISCKWNTLTAAEAQALLNAVLTNVYMNITYPDPQQGTVTKNFYVGDVPAAVAKIDGGALYWNGISFDFIER